MIIPHVYVRHRLHCTAHSSVNSQYCTTEKHYAETWCLILNYSTCRTFYQHFFVTSFSEGVLFQTKILRQVYVLQAQWKKMLSASNFRWLCSRYRNQAKLPVVPQVVLKDLQQCLTEALHGAGIVLDFLHVVKKALCRVPELQQKKAQNKAQGMTCCAPVLLFWQCMHSVPMFDRKIIFCFH